LHFANPSPPSGWVEDFHLQAVEHARHAGWRRHWFVCLRNRCGSVGFPMYISRHPLQHPPAPRETKFSRRLRRMKLAVRSESLCMIWEGFAAGLGQISTWQSRPAG
jgi:hypothetical protein